MAGTIYGLSSADGSLPREAKRELSAVSDFANSWWCNPRSLYSSLRGCFYQGGVTREGAVQVARFDLRRGTTDRVTLGKWEKDDHNVPAFLFEDDKPPMVAAVRHAVESIVRVRIGELPHDLGSIATGTNVNVTFPGACTYAHLIRRPGTNTVALITRSGTDGWYASISTDWGATWGTPWRFHGKGYCTFRIVDGVAIYVTSGHPTTTPNNGLHAFRIVLETGDVTSFHDPGTVVGNLWTGSTVIASANMTVVSQLYDPETVRLFDVGPDGSIAAMKFDKTTPEAGGQYGVYRSKAGGSWSWEPVIASGVPVGYYPSSYVGGMTWGKDASTLYLAREEGGTWSLEQWKDSGDTWAPAEVLRVRAGEQIGRPQVPWGAEGEDFMTAIEYWRYAPDTYQDYYGDQKVYTIEAP